MILILLVRRRHHNIGVNRPRIVPCISYIVHRLTLSSMVLVVPFLVIKGV